MLVSLKTAATKIGITYQALYKQSHKRPMPDYIVIKNDDSLWVDVDNPVWLEYSEKIINKNKYLNSEKERFRVLCESLTDEVQDRFSVHGSELKDLLNSINDRFQKKMSEINGAAGS